MTPKQIKKLDYWIGIPLVFFLTIWKSICSLYSSSIKKTKLPSKILFIKLSEQGSTVLAYSAIQKAIELVGVANVYFWVFEENKQILDILKVIPSQNIVSVKNKGLVLFLYQVIKAIVFLRRNKIDTTIDLEFFSRSSAILSYISGAKFRVGLHRFQSELPYRGNLMTHKIQYNPYIHTAIAFRLMVDSLSNDLGQIPFSKNSLLGISIIHPGANLQEEDFLSIKSIIDLELSGPLTSPVIVINPNAGDLIPERKWDSENFVLLSKKLISHFKGNLTICLTGSPSEVNRTAEIFNSICSDRVINLSGKTNLRTLFALYSISDVLVTNDSGPGHFASMTKIKNIVLFGPETPLLFGPLGSDSHYIEKDFSCRPCVNPFNHRIPKCNDNICMKSISVEEVFEKILQVLK